jgi:hypothetical protein
VGRAAVALAMAVVALGGATDPSTKSFVVRDLELRRGEVLAIALHPTARPIEIEAPNGRLEACQAMLGGEPGGSWPSIAEFDECIELEDGHATLPSVRVDTFHLAFLVRSVDDTRMSVGRLEISYEPGDGFFTVFPPPVRPGATSPRFEVTPQAMDVVSASVSDPEQRRPVGSGVRLRVTQHGERVRRTSSEPSLAGPSYGPVQTGRRVTLQVTNRTEAPAVIGILVDWS